MVAGWFAALLLWPGDPALVVSDVGLAVIAALAAVAYLRAARRWSARYRAHARLMAAACASWSAGQIIWSYLELGRGQDAPFPSLADVGYLGLIPFAIAAVLTVPLQKDRFNRVKLLLDGLIIAGSLLVIGWTLVLDSVVHNPRDTSLGQVITLAYPVGDIVIVTFALSQQSRLLRKGSQSRAFAFTITGLMGLWVADSVYAYLTAAGRYQSGHIEDSGWFIGFLLLCVAAAQPSPAPPTPAAAPPRRAAAGLPYLVAIAAVLITAAVGLRQRQPSVVGIAVLLVTMIFLAVRQYLSPRSPARLDSGTRKAGRGTHR